jgi:prevent-host-death family protein
MNKTIGITVAKARLFEIIDRVEFGETIIIVRNGAPVAQLRPLERAFEDINRNRFAKRRKQSRASDCRLVPRNELSRQPGSKRLSVDSLR